MISDLWPKMCDLERRKRKSTANATCRVWAFDESSGDYEEARWAAPSRSWQARGAGAFGAASVLSPELEDEGTNRARIANQRALKSTHTA